jgi:hypothetical protein
LHASVVVELVAVLVAGGLAIVLVHALRARAWRDVGGDLDGVPVAPIEVADDEIGHMLDGSVVVRQSSARVDPSPRCARGSTPPPIREPARVAAGELVVPLAPRAPTPQPSVDESWDLSDLS